MGTRSLTIIKDEKKEICVIYRQYDGYPSGHGRELAELLAPQGKPIPVVNGISGSGPCFNGAGCLAAQLVKGLKQEAGGIYIYPCGTRDCWEEYTYELHAVTGKLDVSVHAGESLLFRGDVNEFYKWTKEAHDHD